VHETSGTTSWQAAAAQGFPAGGSMKRLAARHSIAGRPDSINNTLTAGGNLNRLTSWSSIPCCRS
jgi:hypothetical protein